MSTATLFHLRVYCLATAFCFCVSWLGAIDGNDDLRAAEPVDPAPNAAALVQQLGSPSFEQREQASAALRRLGIAARPDLKRAMATDDAEVRNRAKQILKAIASDHLQSRIEAFIGDVDGKQQLTVPGWESFRTEFGGEKATRELFVEMIRADGPLVEAVDVGDAKSITENLRAGVTKMMQQNETGESEKSPPTAGQVAILMLAAAHPEVTLDDRQTIKLTHFGYHAACQKAARNGVGPYRNILQKWLRKDSGEVGDFEKLRSTIYFGLPEGVAIGRRMFGANRPTKDRVSGILAVALLGKAEQISLLEPLLKDETIVGTRWVKREKAEIQIRDVALAGVVNLSGHDLRKYGFSCDIIDPISVTDARLYAIPAAKRDAGLQLWRDWRAKQRAATDG